MKKLSLFWRLYLSICASIIVLVVFIITITHSYLNYDDKRDFSDDVWQEIRPLLRSMQHSPVDKAEVQQFAQGAQFNIYLVDPDQPDTLGAYLGEHAGARIYKLPDERLQASITAPNQQRIIVEDRKISPLDPHQHSEAMEEEEEELDTEAALQGTIYNTLIGLILLLVGAVIFFITKALEKPIYQLQAVHMRFADGDQDVRAREDIPSPVDGLAKHFNLMAQQIQTQIKDQQIMTHAIAHELRTPLMRMQMALGILNNPKNPHSPQEQALLDDLDKYIEDMDTLSNSILTLGKIQQQNQELIEPLYADKLIAERIEALRTADQQWLIELNSHCRLAILPMHLQLVIDNLLKNAQRYGNQQIAVQTYRKNHYFILSVADDGDGVAEDQRKAIFNAFARLDTSRSRKTGGHGLGLAITESIIRRYNGDIWVEDSKLGGARFVCRLNLH